MENPEILRTLLSSGWTTAETAPFNEKVGQSASLYLSYNIPNGDNITLCYFDAEKLVKIRIAGQNDKSWFSLSAANNLQDFVSKLIEIQDTITQSNYFGFYFGMQAVAEDFTILAWEQWEPNYR